MERCKFIKDNGEQCKAYAMKNSDYCFTHNPNVPEEVKREARTRGGRATGSRAREPLEGVVFSRQADIPLFIERLINLILKGKIDTKTAEVILRALSQLKEYNLEKKQKYAYLSRFLNGLWHFETKDGVFYCDISNQELVKYDTKKQKGYLYGVLLYHNQVDYKLGEIVFVPKNKKYLFSDKMRAEDWEQWEFKEADEFDKDKQWIYRKHYKYILDNI